MVGKKKYEQIPSNIGVQNASHLWVTAFGEPDPSVLHFTQKQTDPLATIKYAPYSLRLFITERDPPAKTLSIY